MTSNTPSRFMDVAIDWGRVEVWCELSSGKAICGPVLERLRAKAEEIEAERDDLEEQNAALREAVEEMGDNVVALEEIGKRVLGV